MFSYKEKKTDKKAKRTIDLTTAKVLLGQIGENTEPYIYIQKDPFKAEAIRVKLSSFETFSQWLDVINQAKKSN